MPSRSAPDASRDIIVIGGSAGAVEAILQLARGFPPAPWPGTGRNSPPGRFTLPFPILVENRRLYERLMEDFGKRKMAHSAEEMKGKIEAIGKHVEVIQKPLATFGK